MKLDQCHKQKCECGQKTKRDREILGKKKSAKTKHPRHHHHDLEFARGVRFQNFERHQHDDEGHAGLDSFQRAVAKKDGRERYACENEFPDHRAQPISFRFHPKFRRERNEKQHWHPGCQGAEHRRQREKQGGREPQKWPPGNAPVSFAKCSHLNKASVRKHQ